jgi:hypothetical protein
MLLPFCRTGSTLWSENAVVFVALLGRRGFLAGGTEVARTHRNSDHRQMLFAMLACHSVRSQCIRECPTPTPGQPTPTNNPSQFWSRHFMTVFIHSFIQTFNHSNIQSFIPSMQFWGVQ